MFNPIIGWLSPEGRLHECDYMNHLAVAEEIAKQLGAPEQELFDDWLRNRGWVHLTVTTACEHGWAVIFPLNTNHLTQEQHHFLKPYVEENMGFISSICRTDLSYEFEDLFEQ